METGEESREGEMEFVSELPPLTDLVSALEHATLMAKQLPSTTNPCQILQVCSSLQNAHHLLAAFLDRLQSSQPQSGENPVSTGDGEDEPMQLGDDEPKAEAEAEDNSRVIINKVEEQMRDCVLQSKRRKRPLSPSSVAVAEQQGSYGNGLVRGLPGFDPHGTRMRSLDLVFQFHS